MYVTVHRGTQQIGGNLVEIGTAHTRLLFDAGKNLRAALRQPQPQLRSGAGVLTREPICRLWTVRKQRTPLNWRD